MSPAVPTAASGDAAASVAAGNGYSFQNVLPRTASVGERGAAFLVDGLALSLALGVLGLLLLSPGTRQALPGSQLLLLLLLALPLVLAYFTVLEGWGGATPGKRALGIRVVAVPGGRAGFYACFVRNLLRLLWVPAILHLVLLGFGYFLLDPIAYLGYASILADLWLIRGGELDQRLGDLAAGTIVVKRMEG